MKYNVGDIVKVNFIRPWTKFMRYESPVIKSIKKGKEDFVGYIRTNLKDAMGEVKYVGLRGQVVVKVTWRQYIKITDQDFFEWTFEEDTDEIELVFSKF